MSSSKSGMKLGRTNKSSLRSRTRTREVRTKKSSSKVTSKKSSSIQAADEAQSPSDSPTLAANGMTELRLNPSMVRFFDLCPTEIIEGPFDYKPESLPDISSDDEFKSLYTTPSTEPIYLPPKLCEWCSLVHSPSEVCFNKSCNACYSKRHNTGCCAYFNKIPRGANFNRESYDVYCDCNCPFVDTVDWVCLAKYCGGPLEARLMPKECEICDSEYDHNTFECPEDMDRAAFEKSEMEKYFEELFEYVPL